MSQDVTRSMRKNSILKPSTKILFSGLVLVFCPVFNSSSKVVLLLDLS